MHSIRTTMGFVAPLALAALLAGCGKANPQLVADQMTLSDATCAPDAVAKIQDADVRKAFQGRCERRSQFQQQAPAN